MVDEEDILRGSFPCTPGDVPPHPPVVLHQPTRSTTAQLWVPRMGCVRPTLPPSMCFRGHPRTPWQGWSPLHSWRYPPALVQASAPGFSRRGTGKGGRGWVFDRASWKLIVFGDFWRVVDWRPVNVFDSFPGPGRTWAETGPKGFPPLRC